jgi:hypothetical protein
MAWKVSRYQPLVLAVIRSYWQRPGRDEALQVQITGRAGGLGSRLQRGSGVLRTWACCLSQQPRTASRRTTAQCVHRLGPPNGARLFYYLVAQVRADVEQV